MLEVTRSVSIWNRVSFGNCPMLEVTRSVSIWNRSSFGNCPMLEVTRSVLTWNRSYFLETVPCWRLLDLCQSRTDLLWYLVKIVINW